MSRQSKHVYEFGPFRLDAVERLLWRYGEVVPLTPKGPSVSTCMTLECQRLHDSNLSWGRSNERGEVIVLGRKYEGCANWRHRLVRCEVDIDKKEMRFMD